MLYAKLEYDTSTQIWSNDKYYYCVAKMNDDAETDTAFCKCDITSAYVNFKLKANIKIILCITSCLLTLDVNHT